jgi:hypothetical protein
VRDAEGGFWEAAPGPPTDPTWPIAGAELPEDRLR